jgi:hypothetical protein
VRRRAWLGWTFGTIATPFAFYGAWQWRDEWVEKRFAEVVPARVFRGAWQRPGPLRRILARNQIKTVVTLTAISDQDPKYLDQKAVIDDLRVRWIFVPIHGSYATVEEMKRGADLLADPALQPIFYHCVAGHHRSSQVQAAYRIRHEGWSPARAWAEVAALPWARPELDVEDHRLIEAFASAQQSSKDPRDAARTASTPPSAALGSHVGDPSWPGAGAWRRGVRGLGVPDLG